MTTGRPVSYHGYRQAILYCQEVWTLNETLLRKTGRSPVRSGAVAGALSVFVFTIIHDILISDIWFSLLPMAVAGA